MKYFGAGADYTEIKKQYNDLVLGMEEKLREFRNGITPEELEYGYYYDRQVCVDKGHAAEMEAFRQCAAEHVPSPVDLYAGAAANIIAYRAVQSWQEKRRIPLNLDELRK